MSARYAIYSRCPDCGKRQAFTSESREGSLLRCRTRDCGFSVWLEKGWTLNKDGPDLKRWLDVNDVLHEAPAELRAWVIELLDAYAAQKAEQQ